MGGEETNPELEQNGDGEGIKRSVQASYPLCFTPFPLTPFLLLGGTATH